MSTPPTSLYKCSAGQTTLKRKQPQPKAAPNSPVTTQFDQSKKTRPAGGINPSALQNLLVQLAASNAQQSDTDRFTGSKPFMPQLPPVGEARVESDRPESDDERDEPEVVDILTGRQQTGRPMAIRTTEARVEGPAFQPDSLVSCSHTSELVDMPRVKMPTSTNRPPSVQQEDDSEPTEAPPAKKPRDFFSFLLDSLDKKR